MDKPPRRRTVAKRSGGADTVVPDSSQFTPAPDLAYLSESHNETPQAPHPPLPAAFPNAARTRGQRKAAPEADSSDAEVAGLLTGESQRAPATQRRVVNLTHSPTLTRAPLPQPSRKSRSKPPSVAATAVDQPTKGSKTRKTQTVPAPPASRSRPPSNPSSQPSSQPPSRESSKPPSGPNSRPNSKPPSRSSSQVRSRPTSGTFPNLNPTSLPNSLPPSRSNSQSQLQARSGSNLAQPKSKPSLRPPNTVPGAPNFSMGALLKWLGKTPVQGDPIKPLHTEDVAIFWFRNSKDQQPSYCYFCKAQAEKFGSVPQTWTYSYTTGVSPMRQHIEKYHEALYDELCELMNWESRLPNSHKKPKKVSSRPPYSKDGFHRHLVAFIVSDDQAAYLMENQPFRRLLLYLRQELREEDIPHRTRIRDLIIQEWTRFFTKLKSDLSKAEGRISFTADGWSDQNRRNYLAITSHWVHKDGKGKYHLRSALIAFHHTKNRHDGQYLASLSIKLLERAGIIDKTGHWTLDNVNYNTTFMQAFCVALQKLTGETLDPKELQISCFPHVINLSTQRVIKAVGEKYKKKTPAIPAPPFEEGEDEDPDHSLAHRDPFAITRILVNKFRASGVRRSNFSKMIDDGNQAGWWKDAEGNPVTVKNLQLLRDCTTRWDSSHKMNARMLSLKQPIIRFIKWTDDLTEYALTEEEWHDLENLNVILSIPAKLQQSMSSDRTPLLSKTIPYFERFINTWEKLAEDFPQFEEFIEPGLKSAEKYYAKMDRTKSYLVAMFINPHDRLSYIKREWKTKHIRPAVDSVKALMREYYDAANTQASSDDDQRPQQVPTLETPARNRLKQIAGGRNLDYLLDTPGPSKRSVDEEFQNYINGHSKTDVDILTFWQLNKDTYPTIHQMAMDYLPIQASSVPCERVFSSSAETDTKKRSRLTPEFMEILQMLKFGLKSGALDFMTGWETPEHMMTEYDDDSDDQHILEELLVTDTNDTHKLQQLMSQVGRGLDDIEEEGEEDEGWSGDEHSEGGEDGKGICNDDEQPNSGGEQFEYPTDDAFNSDLEYE